MNTNLKTKAQEIVDEALTRQGYSYETDLHDIAGLFSIAIENLSKEEGFDLFYAVQQKVPEDMQAAFESRFKEYHNDWHDDEFSSAEETAIDIVIKANPY